MAKVGRKTNLTKELFSEIKECVLNGNNLKEIANICDIPETTLYTWNSDNYLEIADKIEGWKRDRKIKLAECNIEEMLTMPVNTLKWIGRGEEAEQVVSTNPALIKIKQDTSKFVLEALDSNYKPKKDITSNGNTIGKLLDELDDTNKGTKE